MTKDEQVVLDVLEHNAKQWDASDPTQAQTFRDAARVLMDVTDGRLVTTVTPPAVVGPAAVILTDHTPAPVTSTDPADAPAPPLVHTPSDYDAETPANG
jgi:hypothetical protein